MPPIKRRDLLIGGAVAGLTACSNDAEPNATTSPAGRPPEDVPGAPPPASPPAEAPPVVAAEIPTRILGKTGERIPVLGLGATWLGSDLPSRQTGVGLVQRAFELGIRYFDTATIYPDSESRIGEALQGNRDKCFLTTKSPNRTRDGAMRDLEKSLVDLRSDYVDCWLQHDNRKAHEVDEVLGPGGSLEALIAAKEQKMARYIGFSGHVDPTVLEKLLDAYPFDVVLMAINANDSFDKPFIPTILQKAVAKNLGIIGMKVYGFGALISAITPDEAMAYVLSLPVSGLIIGMKTVEEVERNVEVAKRFKPLAPIETTAIEEKAKKVAFDSTFFRRGDWS